MTCPECGSTATKVTDSRPTIEGTRRRRECEGCATRFTTYEQPRPYGREKALA